MPCQEVGTEAERGESRLKAGPGGTIAADGMLGRDSDFFSIAFYCKMRCRFLSDAAVGEAERFRFSWNSAGCRRRIRCVCGVCRWLRGVLVLRDTVRAVHVQVLRGLCG